MSYFLLYHTFYKCPIHIYTQYIILEKDNGSILVLNIKLMLNAIKIH